MNYTKNFTIEEFRSRDGLEPEARMDDAFMSKLQSLREAFDIPIHISSGIRSIPHNEACGGTKLSFHLSRPCIAADLDTSKMHSTAKYRLLKLCFEHGFTGIGVGKNFIHIDTRLQICLWSY